MQSIHGWTALSLACSEGNKDVVKLLLNHSRSESIDINAKSKDGDTAYSVAKRRRETGIVHLLEEYSKLKRIDLL